MNDNKTEYWFNTKEEELFPRMVQLALVHNYCNARCSRCPIGLSNSEIKKFEYNKDKVINRFLPIEIFKLIADNLNGRERTILRLHGRGEPLLHPNIVDLIRYAKFDCNIPIVTMFTNGLLLNKAMAKKLIINKLDVFDISVDAFNESTYLKYRGTRNWKKIVNNVTELIELRNNSESKAKIVVSAVLDEDFESVKSEFKEFWEAKGVDAAILRPYHNYAGRLENINSENSNIYTPCPQLFTRFSINTNGEVNQCFHDWSDDFIIGKITDQNSIQDIWNSEYYSKLRHIELNQKNRLSNELCNECNIRPNAWSYSYELLLKKIGVIDWQNI
jgi:radical SAM protein with 4Fe4S-binding SPASM domain